MLCSTKGIVFHSIKYSESSIIVKIYTELFGIRSYLFKGVRSSRSKIQPALFQPLSLLDLVVYHKEKQSLQSVKEVRLAYPYKTIPFDLRKSSIALFINELVYKAIREEEANPDLFSFLWQDCIRLDETKENISFFHLFFALQLTNYLGIFPQMNFSPENPVFNLRDGLFQSSVPDHPHYLDQGISLLFYSLLKACSREPANPETTDPPAAGTPHVGTPPVGTPHVVSLRPETRHHLLETILLYYRLHLPGFPELKSHQILHEVLS